MEVDVLKALNKARAAREAVAVLTHMGSGTQELLRVEGLADHALGHDVAARLKSGKSGMLETESGEHFIAVHVPPPRLVIIGAVHISQALYPMAQACGYDVTIIDPRSAFATPERFGDAELLAEWPQDLGECVPFDAFTALVAVTHDPKIDDFPLQKALENACFYVGALGSRKTHAKRLERLRESGVSENVLEKIHAPIGLDIGAANPQEIAVAIMAQIISSLRQGAA